MNTIQDLGGAPTDTAPVTAPAEIPALNSGNTPNIPDGPLRVLRGISNGQIPGAVIPKGTKEIASDLKPEDLQSLGVNFYVPNDETVIGVIFNPEQVSEALLQKADKDGKLSETLPSITSLLGEVGGDEASPESGAAPEPAQRPTTVPVLPRSTFGSDAQGALARQRLQNLTDVPSKRKIPGAGNVLNGLLDRAV